MFGLDHLLVKVPSSQFEVLLELSKSLKAVDFQKIKTPDLDHEGLYFSTDEGPYLEIFDKEQSEQLKFLNEKVTFFYVVSALNPKIEDIGNIVNSFQGDWIESKIFKAPDGTEWFTVNKLKRFSEKSYFGAWLIKYLDLSFSRLYKRQLNISEKSHSLKGLKSVKLIMPYEARSEVEYHSSWNPEKVRKTEGSTEISLKRSPKNFFTLLVTYDDVPFVKTKEIIFELNEYLNLDLKKNGVSIKTIENNLEIRFD